MKNFRLALVIVVVFATIDVFCRKRKRPVTSNELIPNRALPASKNGQKIDKGKIFEKLHDVSSKDDFYKIFGIENTRLGAIGRPGEERRGNAAGKEFTKCPCEPKPFPYELPTGLEYVNYPSCLSINQCSGCCMNKPNHVCKPTIYQLEKVNIYRFDFRQYTLKDVTISLQHHKACSCQCRLSRNDCPVNMKLDETFCYCKCAPQNKNCPAIKQWSDSFCDCVCKDRPRPCPLNRAWDNNTCNCQCNVVQCPIGQRQDPNTCHCK